MLRSYKYRLYPTRSQAVALNGMPGAFCELYNAGLQQRIEAYQRQRKNLRYIDQANELKAVRLADERLAGYSYSAEQQILRRLDKAFAKTLAQREHRCDCGCVLDRDVAAARVVLHLAGLRPGTGLQAQSVRDAA